MAITLPHSAITEIPNTEPAATPALWNTRYNEIDDNFERLATYTPVGTSSTAAGTKAKAVTINGFSLSTNAFVLVKFSNANTASAPTLNVSNTGAKAIYFNGAAVPTGYLEANKFYHFVYDGSRWVLTGDVDVRHLYLPLTGGTITGNLAVQGTTTLTGLLTANGGVTTKALTATSLDLNGNADISGTLKVTGASTLTGLLTANGGVTTKALSATDVTASGTLKVTGATTLTGALAANGGTTTTTLKATGTSTLAAVNATNVSASGTLKVTGATTLTGALAANGGLTTTTIKATGTSTLAAVNATNISASGTLSVTGTSTLTGKLTANGGVTTKALTATSLDLNGNGDVSGTWKVTGATTLTGLLTANGGVTTQKVTATELDLNGNGDVSGNLNVGGLLKVTGQSTYGNRITFNTNQWLFGSRSDVSVADTERDSSTNIIVYRIADKDGAALISEEAYFNQDGSRDLRFNGRNRANTSWRLFLTIKEYANEEVRIIAADSPSASVNDHTLITAKWANEAFVHKSGDETIGGFKTFTGTPYVLGTTGYSLKHTSRDLKIVPEETQQSWVLQYKDKNNLNGLLLKHYQYASGETAVVLSDLNYYGSEEGDWASLSIGHYSDGTRYVKAQYDPLDGVMGYEVVTAKWLRAFLQDTDRSQVVHTTNDETIVGKKTFAQSIFSSANPMVRSANWDGIGVADTSRTEGKQKIIGQVTDKDGKRFIGIEVSADTDGSRWLHINGRNREDTWWTSLVKFGEKADGSIVGFLGGNPVTESNDNSIATTAWVTQKVNSNKLTIGNPVSKGASMSGSCSKNTIVYINSSGAVHDVKINGTTVANTSGYHGEYAQQVTLLVPAGGSWSIGSTGNGSLTSVLYMEIN